MTYFSFLLRFLIPPLLVAAAITLYDLRRGKSLPAALRGWSPWAALLVHVALAVIYTTPWDNYLVATRVWWYDPALVTGLVIGWVPIEEYTFFVLQTLVTGLWLLILARRLQPPTEQDNLTAFQQPVRFSPTTPRWFAVLPVALLWLASVIILVSGWQPGTYLGLELVWALPPIMLQLAFGADLLLRHYRLVLLILLPMTLYLSSMDILAIGAGTWTIDPAQSLNIFIAGRLPIEELIFFFLTNTLIVFGMTLAIATESRQRIRHLLSKSVSLRSIRSIRV
jgi:lycopene cyclase domain-containing protein